MLQQQQQVADATAAPLLGQLVLELPGRQVRDSAEPLHAQQTAVSKEQRTLVAGRGEGRVAARATGDGRVRGSRRRAADVAHPDRCVRRGRRS